MFAIVSIRWVGVKRRNGGIAIGDENDTGLQANPSGVREEVAEVEAGLVRHFFGELVPAVGPGS